MNFGKGVIAIAIGAAVGGVIVFAHSKQQLREDSGYYLSKLHNERIVFMTGKQYLDTCAPEGIIAYSPYDVGQVINVAASGQACWSFMEATIDTLRALGATCSTLDNQVASRVEHLARREADHRSTGAAAVVSALFASNTCVDRPD